ncbi:MAG: protein kinase [Polyangiaceae bacterium]
MIPRVSRGQPIEMEAGSRALLPNTIFAGEFRIVRPLATGGMGSVFVALQLSTGNERALKVIHEDLLKDPKMVERFQQEARLSARIPSDHVVQVLASGVDPATRLPYIAMELLTGETLLARVQRGGPLDPLAARDIFQQLSHALSAAHSIGVVHRDLKPENIVLAQSRSARGGTMVKVLDFGVAKVIAEARTAATTAVGTPSWMAPEQTELRSHITPAADVWAYGLLAFWMLTGRYFWRACNDDSAGVTQLMREVLFEPLPLASERARELGVLHLLPRGFDAFFAKCVVREPGRRVQSIGDAEASLIEVLEGRAGSTALLDAAGSLVFPDTQRHSLEPSQRTSPLPLPSNAAEMGTMDFLLARDSLDPHASTDLAAPARPRPSGTLPVEAPPPPAARESRSALPFAVAAPAAAAAPAARASAPELPIEEPPPTERGEPLLMEGAPPPRAGTAPIPAGKTVVAAPLPPAYAGPSSPRAVAPGALSSNDSIGLGPTQLAEPALRRPAAATAGTGAAVAIPPRPASPSKKKRGLGPIVLVTVLGTGLGIGAFVLITSNAGSNHEESSHEDDKSIPIPSSKRSAKPAPASSSDDAAPVVPTPPPPRVSCVKPGGRVLFAEDFRDNAQGWTLGDTWEIGPAKTSTNGQQTGVADPDRDRTGAVGGLLAGVNLGGNYKMIAAKSSLTSPTIDASSAGADRLMLSFYRWLNSDTGEYVPHLVEVSTDDGQSWASIYRNGYEPVSDRAWTLVTFDISKYVSPKLRVRWAYQAINAQAYTASGWNVDDVVVSVGECL